MFRKNLLVLLFAMVGSSLSAQPKNQENLNNYDLRGNVKSAKLASYYDVENVDSLMSALKAKSKILSPDNYRAFDREGNQIEYKGYGPEGELTTRSVRIFDAGNLTEESSFDGEGNLNSKQVYEYDKMGKLVRENYYDSRNNLIAFYTNRYDERGYLSERRQQKSDGTVDWIQSYKNDEKGNPVEFRETGTDGKMKIFYRTLYSYFADSSIKELTQEIISGTEPGKLVTDFDEKGNKLKDRAYNASGEVLGVREYHYDENGNLIEETTYLPGGSVAQKVRQSFNEYGDRTEHLVFDNEENVRSKRQYKYFYDANGNWILRLEIADDLRYTIDWREVDYFVN